MKNVFNIICLFFIGLFVSCNSLSKEVELSDEIPTIVKGKTLCLDDISIAKEWDSIVIVKPYSNIDELNVDMDFVSKREIKSKVNYDNSCTIVFVKNGELVAFSFVKRDVVDLAKTTKVVYSKKDTIVVK